MRTVGLSALEAKAAAGLVSGDGAQVVAVATARASALADADDGPEALRRSTARVLSVIEQNLTVMTALLAERIAARDEAAVRMLDRLVTGATQRYKWIAEELRLQQQRGRGSVVMVAKGPVAIAAREM